MSQDRVHKPQLLKRKESRSGIEPRSFRLPAYRLTARPNRLSYRDLHVGAAGFFCVAVNCCFGLIKVIMCQLITALLYIITAAIFGRN